MHVRPVLLVLSSYSTKEHTNAHANYHKQRKEDKEKERKVSALVLYSGLN